MAVSLFIGPQGLVFKRAPGPKHPAFEALCRRDPGVLFGLLVGRDYFKVESFLAEDPPDPADLGQAFCIVHPLISGGVLRQVIPNQGLSEAIVVDGKGNLLFKEPIELITTPSTREPEYLQLTSQFHKTAAKPLAVFTQVFNEGPMLKAWETYYSRYLDIADLYVIDDGSSDGSVQALRRGTQVIRLPRGQFDSWGMSNYCSQFQRFLLSKYEWVVHVDCDELLVAKDEFGSSAFMARLEPDQIYKPDEALLVVHNTLTQESAFDFDLRQPFASQRSVWGQEIRAFLKPLLGSRPTTWGPGFHYCLEESETLNDFWLIHLKYVDVERLSYRYREWSALSSSGLTDEFYPHVKELREAPQGESLNLAKDELKKMMPTSLFELPDWVSQQL